jgi:hypothetical protein
MWSSFPDNLANPSSLMKASEPAKSTVPSVICRMPPPEPIDW